MPTNVENTEKIFTEIQGITNSSIHSKLIKILHGVAIKRPPYKKL